MTPLGKQIHFQASFDISHTFSEAQDDKKIGENHNSFAAKGLRRVEIAIDGA